MLASPFVPLFRELLEMRYLWNEPVVMSNNRLVEFLGEEPRTPLVEAVSETLADFGCLARPAPGKAGISAGMIAEARP